jgi:GNAT superfamily N-acetyltransferase
MIMDFVHSHRSHNLCRLTWQYLEDRPMVDFTPPPTVLHGWLTLHWPAHDITAFLSSSSEGTSSVIAAQHDATRTADKLTLADDIRTVFASTLAATDDDDQSTFRLRLATERDLDAMYRLVHGLAVYEKEPDAVHVTQDHYRCDGFATQQPLFFCVLLDSRRQDGNDDHGNDTCSSYTCGMAFCYIARKKTGGLFLYLEDLFIEGDYRGGGAGMMVMKALAAVSLSLGCSKMVWQALDWNTPALNFYNKLGAKVVEGLITARFAGEALPSFASTDSP